MTPCFTKAAARSPVPGSSATRSDHPRELVRVGHLSEAEEHVLADHDQGRKVVRHRANLPIAAAHPSAPASPTRKQPVGRS